MDKVRLEDMKEENEEMRAKLLAKRKKGADGNQEGLLDRLAQMAGQTMPDNFKQVCGRRLSKINFPAS